MRALILGAGSIGRRHMDNLRRLRPGIQLDVVRLDDEGKLAALSKSVPDFAVVATPPHLHSAAVIALLERGVPCYIEKPLVAGRRQLDEIKSAIARLGTLALTVVGCNLRFLPSLRTLKSALARGAIGTPVRASFSAGQWLPDWRPGRDHRSSYSAEPGQGGGVILDLIHEIDQVRWLLGEFDTVRAIAGKYSALEIRSEDAACILFGRKGGPVVSVGLDYVSRRRVRRYEIIGDRGSLLWDLSEQRLELATPESRDMLENGAPAFDVAGTYGAAMAEFLSCVEGGHANTAYHIGDALKTMELAFAARESAGL
jgi:predicted dehydrogenase